MIQLKLFLKTPSLNTFTTQILLWSSRICQRDGIHNNSDARDVAKMNGNRGPRMKLGNVLQGLFDAGPLKCTHIRFVISKEYRVIEKVILF